MARSFVYNRPLDAKILLDPENPNHEFQFNTILEIKKEVETDSLETEAGLSSEERVASSSGLYVDPNHELQLADASNQHKEIEDSAHPKLVIKFRDLWKKSEQSVDHAKKRRKSRSKESKNESSTVAKPKGIKRHKPELNVSSEDPTTRSSLLEPKPSESNTEDQTADNSKQESASDKEDKQDVWNFGRITRLKKNLNILCESCGMCFRTEQRLQAHKRYYTADGEYHCTTCDIRFSRRFQLSRHVKIAHSPLGDEDNYKFKCHLCIDRFEKKASLIAHVTHLHNKHVVTHKRNNNKELLASLPSSYARRKKRQKKVSERKSKRVRIHIVAANSNGQDTKANGSSHSMKDSNETVQISPKKDEQNDKHQHDITIFNNEKVDTRSTKHLTNTNYSTHSETLIPEKLDEEKAPQQWVRSPIKNSRTRPIILRHSRHRIQTVPLNSKPELLRKSRASPRLLERNEERQLLQHQSQETGLDSLPGNVQSRLMGDLVDHLGKRVGNSRVSEPLDQPDKTDHVTDYDGSSVTVDAADIGSETEMANVLRSTRSSILKTIFNSSTDTMSPATYSDRKLTRNEDLSTKGKTLYATSRVHPQSENFDDGLRLLPHHQQLAELQVSSVLADQVSEEFKTTEKNIKTDDGNFNDDDVTKGCNNFGIDLMEVDDFEGTYKSNFVNYENEDVSDGSCESISLKMTASSSNASVTDSLNLDNVNMLTSCNIRNDMGIRDVRVCLVKLENMINLSTADDPPKSSELEDISLVKTETFDCDPCEIQSINTLRERQPSRWQHNSGDVNLIQGSRSMIRRRRVNINPLRKILSNKSGLTESRKVRQRAGKISVKPCFLCDAVFPSTFATATHYLSVHTEAGSLKCCLCYSSFRSLGKLRIHLFKHYRLLKKKLQYPCAVCKKRMRIPSVTRRCTDCDRDYDTEQCDPQEKQFSNALDLPGNQSAREKVSDSENISDSNSEISLVPMPDDREESNIARIDHESANDDEIIVSPRNCEDELKNFRCSACDCVFFENSLLNDHLLTVHGDVERSEFESSQNIAKLRLQTLPILKSHNSQNKPKNRCGNRRSLPKLSVGKKKFFESKNLRAHDKLCKKKSNTPQRLGVLQTNSKHQRPIRHHHVRGNAKTCSDHKCDVCGLNCCCSKSLKIHKKRYLTNGSNVCNICGLTFAWKHVLVMHMKTAHNPKIPFYGKVRCEICNQGFYNRKFLRIHLAHFHNIKYFQCRICRIRFDTARSLNNHRRYYSKNLNRSCRSCGESFKCKYMLEYHKAQVHNREKLKAYKYSCDVCSFAFLDELLLQAHIGHSHNILDREAETNGANMAKEQLPENIELNPLRPETDCIDSNVRTNIPAVREHVNEIHPAQGIAEDVVGKTIRTHTSSEYKCGLCKLSFNDPYAILNHEWEFSNEGTYICPLCNRRFMTDSLLKDHKIKHYQRNVIRKYECYICKEDFSKLDHLKMHGWHLHGPQFAWQKSVEMADINNQSTSEARTNRDTGGGLRKNSADDPFDTIGLASNEILRSGKVRLFKKISNNRSSVELPRRHSNEDSYCCNFCKTNFSSESLLEEHIEKHIYRAYYTNSSRYLCLICKNKFRTNDILRAHVIHCHTAERKKPNLNKPRCSKNSVPAEPEKSKMLSTGGQSTNNKVDSKSENVAANLRPKRAIKPKPSDPENVNDNQRSNGTPHSKKRKLSNSASEVDIVQSNRTHRTSVSRKVEHKTENELGCNYQGGGNDTNRSKSKLVGSGSSRIKSHIDSDSMPEEVKLFTVVVKDAKGLETHTCAICIETFYSVTEFRVHFTSVHVKNGTYLCTFCEKRFPVKSDLKSDILKHEKETRSYVCCNTKFSSITDFVGHKLFHDGQAKEKQNKSNSQLSRLFEAGFFRESNKASNVDKTDNLCRCEICDKAFLDFKTMLKHWDTCIDTNGLQCDLCRATFKSLNSFRLHKTTHHEDKQFSNNTQNRRSCRLSGNRTNEASTQSSIVHDNKLQRRTIQIPAKANATVVSNTVLAAADKISRHNELLKSRKITVKPFAKILPNFKKNNERQKTDTDDATESRSELQTNQGIPSSNRSGVPKAAPRMISITNVGKSAPSEIRSNAIIPVSTVPRPPAKSITQTPDNVRRNASGDHILHHLPVQHSDKTSKRRSLPNNSALRFQQNEHNEQRPVTLQSNASSTAQSFGSSQSPVNSSIGIGNLGLESTTSGQKSLSNDCEVTKPLNLLSRSLNVGDSYYLCIQPAPDSSDNIDKAGAVTSDSGQETQPNDGSRKILPSLIPIPMNAGVSPTYYLCVQPSPDNSSNSSTQTSSPDDLKPKTSGNNYTVKKLPKLLESCSNIVLNPINASDIQRIANSVPNSKNIQNDSDMQPHSGSSKNIRVTARPATAGTSTGRKTAASPRILMKNRNISTEKNASKELVLSKQVVKCSFCNLLFTEKAKLIKHMESHRAITQENQCPACGLTFSNERALQQHLPEHKSSTCTKCDMITFFNDTVDYPRGAEKYCSVCNTVLPLPTRKLNRSATNSPQQAMKCGICMATFSASQMTVHFKMVHSSFVCGICELKFSTKSSLVSHMRTHDTDSHEPFQCKTCKKYFIRLSELTVHMLSHRTVQAI